MVKAQADLSTRSEPELKPINEVGRLLGMASSALRYYDERGLVPAAARNKGKRWYGPHELRRLAFIKIAQRLGIPLATVAAILDAPGPDWRTTVRAQIGDLDHLIEQAKGARYFLEHALDCPVDHPARDCSSMTDALDHIVDGGTVEQLADSHFCRSTR